MGSENDRLGEVEQALRNAEALVDDLQTRLAFQEQAIQDLSDALSLQQRDVGALKRQWQEVQERYDSLQAQLDEAPGQEKPPHY